MLKRLIKYTAILVIAAAVFVIVVKENTMTTKQSVLKTFYPAIMAMGKLFRKNNSVLENTKKVQPKISFYNLSATLNNGDTFNFSQLKGKKVLLVNTASDCGYTAQYEELQQLYTRYKDRLVILAFPANDFKEQEKAGDEAIAQFCKLNYGISFPLMKKTSVLKSSKQHPVFRWLTDSNSNGWNEQAPSWNFSKYLVDESGILVNYFEPAVSPLSETVINAITRL